MMYRRFKYEGWLYGLAFLLALGLRLVKLGALPLTDAEAESALQALHVAQGLKPALAPYPLYILLTAPVFFIFGGGTNFLARFLPALAGSVLVFVPLLFQGRLKPRPSLILAFFLVFDPGLMTLSREAASSIFAITFLLFAWGFWINHRTSLAGGFLALALLSGPSVWAGLLALGISWAIRQGIETIPGGRKRPVGGEPAQDAEEAAPVSQLQKIDYRPALISFIATFLIVGSLLLMVPAGLGAALASLPEYLRGWNHPSNVPASRLFASLLVYQPLAVLLAILAIGRGWMRASRRIVPLSLWLLVALLLALFYPAHQVTDLAWTLMPLYALAALEFSRQFDAYPEERREVIGVILLVLFIVAFGWLDLASFVWTAAQTAQASLRLWLFFGSFFLLLLSILLVAAGWSMRVARLGAIHGLAIALGIFSFGGALGSVGLRGMAFPEMWWPVSRPAQADLLVATINDLSGWGLGNDQAAPVVIVKIDSPSLEWALRDRPVTQATALDPTAAPDIVITSTDIDPRLASSYRGQDFTWRQIPAWETLQREAWIRWIVLRELPQNGETLILWAREDLFLDSPTRNAP